MPIRRLDNIRGSWLAIVAVACGVLIFLLGLGSERVRRVVREALPASLGGTTTRADDLFGPGGAGEEGAKEEEADPDALPAVAKEEAIRGVVRDGEGKPIPGAAVTAERWRRSRWEVLASARSNREGEFVLGPVPRAHLSAVARAEGFASQRKPVITGSRVEFSLKSGGTLLLKVVDAESGDPIPGSYLSGWSSRGDWYETGSTGGDGTHRFPSVPPGRLWLSVHAPEHRKADLGDLEVFEGKETYKEIPLVRGGSLKGLVLDAETKAPVPRATLRTWEGSKGAESGEDGRYELKSPDPGGMSLRVSAEGYPEQWTWVQVTGDVTQDVERNIEIGRGGKVSGVVLRPDGSPAPGARVGRDPGELMTGVPEDTAVADGEGRFTLEAVPAMRGGRLFAVADGFALSRSDPLEIRSGTEVSGIRILLQSGAALRGSVRDEEGEPMAGVSFQLNREWSRHDGGGWFWIPELVGYSLADGTWEIASVPQGTYTLRVNLEGFAPESRGSLVAPAEGALEGLDFVLRKGSVITGRVRSLAGDLLPGVGVTAWGWVMGSEGKMEWNQRAEVRTTEEGFFEMDGLRDGAYNLQFQATGFAHQERQGITAGTRELQVTLMPTARIEGRVLEPDGVTPATNFQIRLILEVDGNGNPQGAGNVVNQQDFADREGKFVLHDVPEGQVGLVAVSGNRISTRQGGIVITAGTVMDRARLVLSVGGRLRVTVRDAAGTPLQGANVSAGRQLPGGQFQTEYWAQTDAEGVASFAAMADGNWVLWAQFQNRLRETRTVNVGSGVDAEVDMVLKPGGSVLVHVTDGRGLPVEGAQVVFRDPATGQDIQVDWGRLWQDAQQRHGGRVDWQTLQREAQFTGPDGRLLRVGLNGGPVTVIVRREGLREWTGTARVQDGFEIDLHARVEAADPPPLPPGGGRSR